MKIRLADDEIRLRVTNAEVDTLLRGEAVSAAIWNGLSFTVLYTDATASRVVSEANTVVIEVPRGLANTPNGDSPMIHDFMDQTTHVLVELDLGRRPR